MEKVKSGKQSSHLELAPVIPGNKKEPVIVPLTGMEWEARKLLYQLVDTVVDMASHKEVLNILLPAKDLDCEDWQEIEIPVRPRSSEEQDSLSQILDELDNRTAKTTTPVETTKQKPCKGRKKK